MTSRRIRGFGKFQCMERCSSADPWQPLSCDCSGETSRSSSARWTRTASSSNVPYACREHGEGLLRGVIEPRARLDEREKLLDRAGAMTEAAAVAGEAIPAGDERSVVVELRPAL